MNDWNEGELIDLDDGDGYEDSYEDGYDDYDDSEIDVYNDDGYDDDVREEKVTRRAEPPRRQQRRRPSEDAPRKRRKPSVSLFSRSSPTATLARARQSTGSFFVSCRCSTEPSAIRAIRPSRIGHL